MSADLSAQNTTSVASYFRSGQPYIWLTAAAISVCFIITIALLALTAIRGLPHFWPSDVMRAEYAEPGQATVPVFAQIMDTEEVTTARLLNSGAKVDEKKPFHTRDLLKIANRDLNGEDFKYVIDDWLVNRSYPKNLTVLERSEWGNFHGTILSLKRDGNVIASGDEAYKAWLPLQERADKLRDKIKKIEKKDIGAINYEIDKIRLETKRLALDGKTEVNAPKAYADLAGRKSGLDADYAKLTSNLDQLKADLAHDALFMQSPDGKEVEVPLAKIIRGYQPNNMNIFAKIKTYFSKLGEFIFGDPREANTEGGIFPAIFGTVMMVLLMSVFVTPLGILAALYLREYAKQGFVTQVIRIAVNNLAGVPSIVYGMFGLGFFVYFMGGNIDHLFYPDRVANPTFGTPGLLWSSLTLAILTLPVVIVATEEGLARIPRSIREASLALGATKVETLWKVVLPMASPAMMTGLILAIARAAGEVAPLMLVGVVKLAPTLPVDGSFPFLHLERKFMHLGFHIFDVGFQSPNIEAARPLVYATSFLLVLVIILLNVSAIRIRNNLRDKYKSLEG